MSGWLTFYLAGMLATLILSTWLVIEDSAKARVKAPFIDMRDPVDVFAFAAAAIGVSVLWPALAIILIVVRVKKLMRARK